MQNFNRFWFNILIVSSIQAVPKSYLCFLYKCDYFFIILANSLLLVTVTFCSINLKENRSFIQWPFYSNSALLFPFSSRGHLLYWNRYLWWEVWHVVWSLRQWVWKPGFFVLVLRCSSGGGHLVFDGRGSFNDRSQTRQVHVSTPRQTFQIVIKARVQETVQYQGKTSQQKGLWQAYYVKWARVC